MDNPLHVLNPLPRWGQGTALMTLPEQKPIRPRAGGVAGDGICLEPSLTTREGYNVPGKILSDSATNLAQMTLKG